MIDTFKAGGIGEIQALADLSREGFIVFVPVSDGSPIDIVAIKPKTLNTFKVEVKTTKYSINGKDWIVQLKRVRSNKTVNRVYPFNNTIVDILAVYISPLDRVVFYRAKDIQAKTAITIKGSDLDNKDFGRLSQMVWAHS